jgi:polysaccharide export outer membrane protein
MSRLVTSTAGFTMIAAIALAGAACGTVRSAQTPDQMPVLPGGPSTLRAGARAPMPGPALARRDGALAASPAPLNNHRLPERPGRLADADDLPIGAGDLIELSVFEVEELSKLKVRVPMRGTISLPLIGHVQASGRTSSELEEEVRARLQQRFMYDPQVSVFVLEHNSQQVSVIGAVRRGGVFPLNRRLYLADALAMAEGLADDADGTVYVIRRAPPAAVVRVGGADTPTATGRGPARPPAEVVTPIDLSALAAGQEELNVELQSGDVVQVPRAGSFYVGGSVERAGSFVLRGRTTLHQAILAAGGVKNVADWSDIRLYRRVGSGEVSVSNYDLGKFEEGQPSPEIERNDVVVVGTHAGKAFLYGFIDFFRGALGVAKGI